VARRIDLKKLWQEKFPVYSSLIVFSILYLILRWAVLRNVPERTTYNYFYGKDIAVTIYTMLQTVPLYFRLTFAPYDMLYHYSGYLPYRDSFASFAVIFPVIFIIVLLTSACYLLKRLPVASYGILFFFITLLPVLNIVPTMNFMGDRFLYIPSVIVSFIFVAIALKYYSKKNLNIIYVVFGIILLGYSYLTIARNADWKNNDTLFMSADNRPGTVTYVNIGNIYANKQQYDIAETYYRKALDLRREVVLANNNLGKVFMVKGNFDSAYYYMYQAHLLDTLSPEPMHALAQLHAGFEKIPEAISWLEKIQAITPGYMNSDKMLAELKNKQLMGRQPNLSPGDTKKAAILEQSSYNNYQAKNYDKAIDELTQLLKINPLGAAGYNNNIGMCYLESGRYKEAIKYFNSAIKVSPDFSAAYNNLGDCYDKVGDKEKAIESYSKALEVDPNNQNAKRNLERVK
jgi:tetratricopeptide (TPR) repeat protein